MLDILGGASTVHPDVSAGTDEPSDQPLPETGYTFRAVVPFQVVNKVKNRYAEQRQKRPQKEHEAVALAYDGHVGPESRHTTGDMDTPTHTAAFDPVWNGTVMDDVHLMTAILQRIGHQRVEHITAGAVIPQTKHQEGYLQNHPLSD